MKKIISLLVLTALLFNLNFVSAAQKKTTVGQVKNKVITICGYKGTYTGWFSNNKPNGYGTFVFNSKSDSNSKYTLIGTWKNGISTQNATEIYIPSSDTKYIFKGSFYNLFLNGKGSFVSYKKGKIQWSEEGWFSYGIPNGYCVQKFYGDNGQIISKTEGNFKDGIKIITLSDYDSLTNGMSYFEATQLLGSDGEQTDSNSVSSGDYTVTTESYTWKIGDAEIFCIFQNDELVSKSQYGLSY